MSGLVVTQAKTLVSQFDLSAYLKNYKPTFMAEAKDKTNFASGRTKEFAAGLKSGSMSFEGFFDKTLIIGSDVVLAASLGAAGTQLISCAPDGLAVGAKAHMMETIEPKYEVNTDLGELAMITAEMQATGSIGSGVSLHDLVSENTTAGTGGTSVDNGAASTGGAFAHLHHTSSDAGAGGTIKVQHSTNNSTWVDLMTFTALVGNTPSSQRIELADNVTVNRYVRAFWVVTGSSLKITFALTFCRK